MIKGYYFITDAGLSKRGNASDVKNAIESGVSIVQYRNKIAQTRAMYEEAVELRKICKNKVLFIINDRVDISLSVGADGVHLGQEDMPYETARKLLGKKKIIGVTVHDLAEAIMAEKKKADYIGVSPIFATATKEDAGEPCGVAVVRDIKKKCKLPIAAIGGINLSNAKEVIAAGADAICAISAVVTKDDVKKEIEKFQRLFR
jgi:thiamine-phosphate pyrophosphorylase